MGTFLIILLLICLFWPWISKWAGRWASRIMAHRAEDMFRRMAGAPTRKEEERMRRRANKERGKGKAKGRRKGTSGNPEPHPGKLMNEVAVDAEYTEIREFSERAEIYEEPLSGRVVVEEQVSDAEYVEIKGKPHGRDGK